MMKNCRSRWSSNCSSSRDRTRLFSIQFWHDQWKHLIQKTSLHNTSSSVVLTVPTRAINPRLSYRRSCFWSLQMEWFRRSSWWERRRVKNPLENILEDIQCDVVHDVKRSQMMIEFMIRFHVNIACDFDRHIQIRFVGMSFSSISLEILTVCVLWTNWHVFSWRVFVLLIDGVRGNFVACHMQQYTRIFQQVKHPNKVWFGLNPRTWHNHCCCSTYCAEWSIILALCDFVLCYHRNITYQMCKSLTHNVTFSHSPWTVSESDVMSQKTDGNANDDIASTTWIVDDSYDSRIHMRLWFHYVSENGSVTNDIWFDVNSKRSSSSMIVCGTWWMEYTVWSRLLFRLKMLKIGRDLCVSMQWLREKTWWRDFFHNSHSFRFQWALIHINRSKNDHDAHCVENAHFFCQNIKVSSKEKNIVQQKQSLNSISWQIDQSWNANSFDHPNFWMWNDCFFNDDACGHNFSIPRIFKNTLNKMKWMRNHHKYFDVCGLIVQMIPRERNTCVVIISDSFFFNFCISVRKIEWGIHVFNKRLCLTRSWWCRCHARFDWHWKHIFDRGSALKSDGCEVQVFPIFCHDFFWLKPPPFDLRDGFTHDSSFSSCWDIDSTDCFRFLYIMSLFFCNDRLVITSNTIKRERP